jgi:VWFA-related protein
MKRLALATLTALLLMSLTASSQIIIGPEDDPTYIDTTVEGSSPWTGAPGFTEYAPTSTSWVVDSVNISGLDCSGFPTTCFYVDVVDSTGIPIPGLTADSFCVYQDGVPIDSFSVLQLSGDSCVTSVCFVVDLSGSMRNYGRLDSAQAAMHRFVDNMDPFDRVAIVGFSSCVTLEIGFTSDQTALHAAIDTLDAHGKTAMFDGIWKGVDLTTTELGSKAVIAYSDGLENGSQHCWPPPDGITSSGNNHYINDSVMICDLANAAGIPIYTTLFRHSPAAPAVFGRTPRTAAPLTQYTI